MLRVSFSRDSFARRANKAYIPHPPSDKLAVSLAGCAFEVVSGNTQILLEYYWL
jgi:hypothetical protein